MSDAAINTICDTVMWLSFWGFGMWVLTKAFGDGKD